MRKLIFIFSVCFTVASAQDSTRSAYYFEKGNEAMTSRDYLQAIRNFTTGLQLQPGYYEAYLYRGMARNNADDLAGALTDYSIYLDQDPLNAEALFQRGFLHYMLQHFDQARADFKLLLTIENSGETNSIVYRTPAFSEGVDKMFTSQNGQKDYVHNYLGLCEMKLGHYAEAVAAFNDAINLNSRDPNYYVHRGLAHQAMGDISSAKRDFRQALSLDPNHGLALNNLAVISRASSGADSIEFFLAAAIERSPDLPYPYAERGYYWLQQKEYASAVEDYTQAIRIMPTDHELWLNRAIAHSKLGKLTEALADLDRVVALKPALAQGYMNRGNIYTQLKEFSKAINEYNIAIVYDPSYGLAFYNRAIAYRSLKEFKKACEDLTRAEQLGMAADKRLRESVCREP